MKNSELTTVTYLFADNSKQVQPITNKSFEGGKKGNKTMQEMHDMFADTASDKGKACTGYTLDGNIESQDTVISERIQSSKAEIKTAKRDLKEMKQRNPKGFHHSLNQFKAMVVDKFASNTRRIRFNVKQGTFA